MAAIGFIAAKPSLTFLLAFVRGVDAHLNDIESRWGAQQLSSFRFTHFLAAYVYRPSDGGLSSSMVDALECPQQPSLQQQVAWEKRMYAVHNVANGGKDVNVESFENMDQLMYCLFGIFGAIAEKVGGGKERAREISFHDFRAFVLNITIGGKNGVDDNEVKPITLTRSPSCRALYRMNKLLLMEEQNVLLATIVPHGDTPAQLRMLDGSTLDVVSSVALPASSGPVASMETVYVESPNAYIKLRVVVLSCGDGCLRLYDFSRLRVLKAEVDFKIPQHSMKFVAKRGLLITGGTKGALTFISMIGFEKYSHTLEVCRTLPTVKTLQLHDDSITAVEPDHFAESIFSSSLDRIIYQVQLKDFGVLRRLSGHQLGINSIAFNHHYNVVVSCGMDYQLYAWTLEATEVEPLLMVDAAHPYHHTVVQVATVEAKPFVISMDVKGLLKVWDVRTLRCICSVACEPDMMRAELENLSWHCFVIHRKNFDVITAANRKIFIFEYDVDDRGLGSYCAHEGPIAAALYDERSRTLISLAKTEVQVWNPATARVVNRIREVTPVRISAALLLEGAGTMVIATVSGNIKFISTASFAVLAEWVHTSGQAPHILAPLPDGDGVVAVVVSGQTELIFFDQRTGAIDGVTLERKEVPIRASFATSMKSQRGSWVLVGDHQNAVAMWAAVPGNPRKYKEVMKSCNYPADRPVVAIAPFPRLSCFVSVDNRGWFNMWAVDGPAEQTWTLAKWVSRRPPELAERPVVTKAVICDALSLLFTGDEFGAVNCYDLSVALGRTDWPRGEGATFNDVPGISAPRCQLIPPLLASWEAHPESKVTELFVMRTPLCVVTGGDDCRLQAWSLGGHPVTMFIMRKLGQLVGEQPGIEFLDVESDAAAAERYNDLPAPYGKGVSGEHSSQAAKADELLASPGKGSTTSAKLQQQLLHSSPSFRYRSPTVVDGAASEDGMSDGDRDALQLVSFGTATSGSPESRRRKSSVPFWKEKVPRLGPPPKTKTVERAPVIILPANDEILYDVPQFVGLDKVGDPSRPQECHYAPECNVDHAMYGPNSNFWSLNERATKLAQAAILDAQEKERALAAVLQSFLPQQHASPHATAAKSPTPSALSPPLLLQNRQPLPMGSTFGVGNKALLKECSREAFAEWQSRVQQHNAVADERARREWLTTHLAEAAAASPHHRLLAPIATASPLLGSPSVPALRRSQSVSPVPAASLACGSSAHHPTSSTPPPASKTRTRYTVDRASRRRDLEQSLPEGMVVPQVRALAGNRDHVKSHQSKPF